MASLLDRLKERKLVQWAVAYVAGAWVVLQVMDVVAEPLGLTAPFQLGILIVVGAGFFVAVVLAWYHGEKGSQRLGGMELVAFAVILAATGFFLRTLPASEADPDGPDGREGFRVPLAAQLYTNPAVAVLVFANMGSDDDQTFVDGLHEEVLGNLGKIGALTVLSRQAVLRYRDSEMSIREIGEELGVDAVLEGSVRRAGDRLRITAQLIHAESDAHLWVETFDDELTVENIFAIQERVAREVARALQAVLTPEEDERIAAVGTHDLTAYGLFLAQRTLGSNHEARIRLLQQAIERDSAFAPAWAALGARYSFRIQDEGYLLAWADSGRAAARRAIDLDPELSQGYMALGHSYYLGEGKLQAAIEPYSRALQVQPNHGPAANPLGVILAVMGRWPEAIELFKRDVRLRSRPGNANTGGLYSDLGLFDKAEAELEALLHVYPRSPFGLAELSKHLARKGEFERAVQPIERTIRARPDHVLRRQWAARLALISGDLGKAREHAEEAFRLGPDGLALLGDVHSVRTTLGYVRLVEGKQEEADSLLVASLEQLESLLDGGADDPFVPAEISAIKAAQGRTGEAVSWFQRAYDTGFRHFRLVELDPMFDSLRGDPEFERIMADMRADVEVMREEVLAMEAELEAARLASGRDAEGQPE